MLVGYASMLRLLASEQLAGRLAIAPEVVFSASEVLTGETRRRIQQAWGRLPFDVYAATETAGIAAECQVHRGLHLFWEEALSFPTRSGGQVTVQTAVFHPVMDGVPAEG